jgi:hypothetical protein
MAAHPGGCRADFRGPDRVVEQPAHLPLFFRHLGRKKGAQQKAQAVQSLRFYNPSFLHKFAQGVRA